MSAITAVRDLLTEHSGGLNRAQILDKITTYDTVDVLRAIKDLKDSSQVIKLGDGDAAYYVMASAASATETKALPASQYKPEINREPKVHQVPASKPIEPAPVALLKVCTLPRGGLRAGSSSAQVGLYLFEQKTPDGWKWVKLGEIHAHLSASSKAEVGRINTALVFMVSNGYLDRHPETRGMYRWANKYSHPLKDTEGQSKMPSKVVILEPQNPISGAKEDQPENPDVQTVKTGKAGNLINKLHELEVSATESFIEKAREMVVYPTEAQRIEVAKLMARIDTLQECIALHEAEEAA